MGTMNRAALTGASHEAGGTEVVAVPADRTARTNEMQVPLLAAALTGAVGEGIAAGIAARAGGAASIVTACLEAILLAAPLLLVSASLVGYGLSREPVRSLGTAVTGALTGNRPR